MQAFTMLELVLGAAKWMLVILFGLLGRLAGLLVREAERRPYMAAAVFGIVLVAAML